MKEKEDLITFRQNIVAKEDTTVTQQTCWRDVLLYYINNLMSVKTDEEHTVYFVDIRKRGEKVLHRYDVKLGVVIFESSMDYGYKDLERLAEHFLDSTILLNQWAVQIPVASEKYTKNISTLREMVIKEEISVEKDVANFLKTIVINNKSKELEARKIIEKNIKPIPTIVDKKTIKSHEHITSSQLPVFVGDGLRYNDNGTTILQGYNTPEITDELRKYPGVYFKNGVHIVPPRQRSGIMQLAMDLNIPIQPELIDEIRTAQRQYTTLGALKMAPLTVLPSITDKRAEKFAKVGIDNLYELIFTLPRKYIDRSSTNPISFLTEGEEVGIIGTVTNVSTGNHRGLIRISVSDTTGTLTATFFNATWMLKRFKTKDSVLLYGKTERWKPHSPLSMTNPMIEHYQDNTLPIVPVYPQSGKNNVTSAEISGAIREAIVYIENLVDVLPKETLNRNHLINRSKALQNVHLPNDMSEIYIAKKRLAFDELLRIQIAFLKNKQTAKSEKGISHVSDILSKNMVEKLPFPLTGAQSRAISEIRKDMISPQPMHRLLQGDVGSGKAQPLTSLVLTADGYTTMGEIKIGTQVVNPEGGNSTVIGIYPQGKRPLWKILFADNSYVMCDYEHLWQVKNIVDDKSYIFTTGEIKEKLKFDDEMKIFNFIIPKYVEGKGLTYPSTRKIVEIIFMEESVEMQCIALDSLNKLYVTDNFTVTHNTIVATSALLTAVSSGFQAVLMAPTEILARQLHEEVKQKTENVTIDGIPVKIDYFTNQLRGKKKEQSLKELAAGETHIAVGTHALLSDDIEFKSLGLVVIDEQHRFGVEQRAKLKTKTHEGKTPDTLVMTATPIPRTSAMTIFGDLDITILDELPPGRTPITTQWYDSEPELLDPNVEPWPEVRKELEKGRQAFIVCPLVEESEKLQVASAKQTHEELTYGALKGYKVGLIHGQQKPAERDVIMNSFRDGDLDVIVATTVIEVGVNIPNATMIVILDAIRFGISQLHQLRGRVGRGNYASQCVLVGRGKSSDSRERMEALVASTDGFELSEVDLKLRGHGSMFGTSQSGMSDLRVADLRKDQKTLIQAREEAEMLMEKLTENDALVKEVKALHPVNDIEWLSKS